MVVELNMGQSVAEMCSKEILRRLRTSLAHISTGARMSREIIRAAAEDVALRHSLTILRKDSRAGAYFSKMHLQAEVRLSQSDVCMYQGSQSTIGTIHETNDP